jgi:hypothetical protein
MNVKTLAAHLRAQAKELDLLAWQLEAYAVAHAPGQPFLKASIAAQRQLANQLRANAQKLTTGPLLARKVLVGPKRIAVKSS